MGGTSDDVFNGQCIDQLGNTYVIGDFRNTITLGTQTLQSAGSHDIVVAKYNDMGEIAWAVRFGGTGDDHGRAISMDAVGGLYITGSFSGTAFFGTTPVASGGNTDVFIAKLDLNGSVQWVHAAGGSSDDAGIAISSDLAGNTFLTGYYHGTARFGTLPPLASASSNSDAFVAAYDPQGDAQWVRGFGGSLDDHGHGIVIDPVFNMLYVTGKQPGYGYSSETQAFVRRYDPSTGNLMWTQQIRGYSSDNSGNGITVDNEGNPIVVGTFGDHSHIGNLTFNATGYHSNMFIAKFASLTGAPIWYENAGGTGDDGANAVAFDKTDSSILAVGTFHGSITFDARTLQSHGGTDVYMAKYSTDGIMQWVISAGGAADDAPTAVTTDVAEHMFMCGSFSSTATFGGTTCSSAGSTDGFACRLLDRANMITGNVFLDVNNNGVRDAEKGVPSVLIKVTPLDPAGQPLFYTTDANGNYVAYTTLGTSLVTIANHPQYHEPSPVSYSVPFGTAYAQTAGNKNFALYPEPFHQDMRATLTTSGPLEQSKYVNYNISYTNNGTAIMSGTVRFEHDLNLSYAGADPLVANPPADSYNPSTGTFVWRFSNMLPGEQRWITVPLGLSIPEPGGIVFASNVIIEPILGDETPQDNMFTLQQTVGTSHEAIELSVDPAPSITLGEIKNGKPLTYTINFQNTGTAPVTRVKVRDTLGTSLDVSTLEVLGTSHPATFSIAGRGILEWVFNGINLPPVSQNQAGSRGSITFRVQPIQTVASGDIIPNRAAVYFDFGDPVMTNVAQTEVIEQRPLTRLDSLRGERTAGMAPYLSTRVITLLNHKLPASPITGLAIRFVQPPALEPIFQELIVDGRVREWAPSNGVFRFSPAATNDVEVTLAVNDSSHWVGNVVFTVYHADGDSLVWVYGPWTADLPLARGDSMRVTPYTFSQQHIVGRAFTALNRKVPESPVSLVDIRFVPPPRFAQIGGGLTIDGSPLAWNAPFTTIVPFPPVTDAVTFNLGLIDSSNWIGNVEVTLHHTDGDSSVLVYGPWSAYLVGVGERMSPGMWTLLNTTPHPARDEATLRYVLGAEAVVSMEVLDLFGRVVAVPDAGMRGEGLHTVRYNIASLPTGHYTVRLTVRGEAKTTPLVIVK